MLQNVSPSTFVLQNNGLIYSKPLNEVVEVKVQKHNKSQTAIQHFHFFVKPRESKRITLTNKLYCSIIQCSPRKSLIGVFRRKRRTF